MINVYMVDHPLCILKFPKMRQSVRWTPQELETLLIHIELLGPQWDVIAKSMQRTRASILRKHKLIVLHSKQGALDELRLALAFGTARWG